MSNQIRKAPVQPRLSASLVVVNPRNEVLLVHRNPDASAFGGMHVFPGGILDETQDESLQMTALRETFEESGLLLASSLDPSALFPSDSILDDARHAIHEQRMNFGDFMQTHRLRPVIDLLFPFTRWITPTGLPRRFKTQFYLAFLPATSPSSRVRPERLPMHDGKREVIEARFVHPKAILKECREGKIRCMPPQFYILSTLANILSGQITSVDQRKQVEDLSSAAFGKMTITPRMLVQGEDGHFILALNGDEEYGGPIGRRHRILGNLVKSGPLAASTLIRNFDILNEMETHLSSHHGAKL